MLWMLLLQTALSSLLVQAAVVLKNYTVNDNDTSITYLGDWKVHESPLAYEGSHKVAYNQGDRAIFTFSGVSVYYLAPLWRSQIETRISLDGDTPVLVNLTATPDMIVPPWEDETQEVVPWDIRWSATNLTNSTHTVTITRGVDSSILDGFRFTVPVEDGKPVSFSASSNRRSIIIASIISVLITALIFGLILLLIWIILRRRQQESSKARGDTPAVPGPTNEVSANGAAELNRAHPSSYGDQELAIAAPVVPLDLATTPMPNYATGGANPVHPASRGNREMANATPAAPAAPVMMPESPVTNHSPVEYHNISPGETLRRPAHSVFNHMSQSITTLPSLQSQVAHNQANY
ncbi:hypothetical protein FRC17_010664 [Serendipita sp. 399]|nr:hypothetical protein FRC17_010664 [Serendipita sp. 399]